MLPSSQRNSRLSTAVWILGGTLAFYVSTLYSAASPVDFNRGAGLAVQMFVWAGTLVVAAEFSRGHLRISNPLSLLMLWCLIYLVLPSVFWLQRGAMPFVTPDYWLRLQYIHALFMGGLLCGYLIGRPRSNVALNQDFGELPRGWALFWMGAIPSLGAVAVRVFNGGGIIADASYGEYWTGVTEYYGQARRLGGSAYFLAQLWSKFNFFPTLLLSIGLGLILGHRVRRGGSPLGALALAGVVVLVHLVLSGSSRSSGVIVAIIATLVLDLTCKAIRFSHVAAAIVSGLLVFDLLGVLRRDSPDNYLTHLPAAIQTYADPRYPRMHEFAAMLSKEALMLHKVDENGTEPVVLARHALNLIPSQINPLKLQWTTTTDMLCQLILGKDAVRKGHGTAGSFIGDSYRIGGYLGVFGMALLVGLIFGGLQRWAFVGSRTTHRDRLVKCCLWAGFLGWAFFVIRNDLGGILTVMFYYIAIPWVIWKYLGKTIGATTPRFSSKDVSYGR